MAARFFASALLASLAACVPPGEPLGREAPITSPPVAASADAGAPSREVLAWVIGDDESVASLKAQRGVTLVSPVLHRVSFEGSEPKITTWSRPQDSARLSREVSRFAERDRLPLVACGGPSARRLARALAEPATAKRLEDRLFALADGEGGVLLDFEGLVGDSESLSSLVANLGARLRSRNKRLALALPAPCPLSLAPAAAKTSSCVEPAPASAYDFRALTAASDLVAIMLYDHDTTGARAPQPREWIEGAVARLAALVPKEQFDRLAFGVPLYGRIDGALMGGRSDFLWSALERGRVRGRRVRTGSPRFDAAALSNVATATVESDGGAQRGPIFIEDHTSTQRRLALALELGFTKVALWRLGGEDPCTALVLDAFRTGQALGVRCVKPSAR